MPTAEPSISENPDPGLTSGRQISRAGCTRIQAAIDNIRRMNPRDTAANMQRRKMIRRGATYGPLLPEGAPDDGVERQELRPSCFARAWCGNSSLHSMSG